MTFKAWRERQRLSQERVAEMSGLGLRTVQRLEAGHRVSYASLRALAATFETDVDTLERELYAMKTPTDDFVEAPRWIRLLDDSRWFGGPRPSRRDVHVVEVFLMACAVAVFAMSFLVAADATAKILRGVAALELALAYLVSVFVRIADAYKLWPEAGDAGREQRPRTRRGRVAEYVYALGAAMAFVVVFRWLVF